MMNSKKLFFVILLVLLIFPLVNSLSEKEEAEKCLAKSEKIMQELSENNFSVQRINDSIRTAWEIFELESKKESVNQSDYSLVFSYCNETTDIKTAAYEASDEIYSLEKNYLELSLKLSNFDNESAIYSDIQELNYMMIAVRQEMADERYEEVINMADEISKKITEVDASATTTSLFYQSLSKNLKEFFYNNYLYFLGFIFLCFAFYIFYKLKLRKYFIKRKILRLEVEKKVVQDMLKQLQREYFEKLGISEGEYRIKTKKFAEIIRDIERQIPLFREELAKMNGKLINTKNKIE